MKTLTAPVDLDPTLVDFTPIIPRTAKDWCLFTGPDHIEDAEAITAELREKLPGILALVMSGAPEGAEALGELHADTLGSERGLRVGGGDSEPNLIWGRLWRAARGAYTVSVDFGPGPHFGAEVTVKPECRFDVFGSRPDYWLRFFGHGHLPAHLQEVVRPFHRLAADLADRHRGEKFGNAEEAVKKLLEAKDCAVRAALDSHRAPPVREGLEVRRLGRVELPFEGTDVVPAEPAEDVDE